MKVVRRTSPWMLSLSVCSKARVCAWGGRFMDSSVRLLQCCRQAGNQQSGSAVLPSLLCLSIVGKAAAPDMADVLACSGMSMYFTTCAAAFKP